MFKKTQLLHTLLAIFLPSVGYAWTEPVEVFDRVIVEAPIGSAERPVTEDDEEEEIAAEIAADRGGEADAAPVAPVASPESEMFVTLASAVRCDRLALNDPAHEGEVLAARLEFAHLTYPQFRRLEKHYADDAAVQSKIDAAVCR